MPKCEIIYFDEVEFDYVILDVLRMLPLCVNHVRALVGDFYEFYVKIHMLMEFVYFGNYAMNMLVDHIVIAYMSIWSLSGQHSIA